MTDMTVPERLAKRILRGLATALLSLCWQALPAAQPATLSINVAMTTDGQVLVSFPDADVDSSASVEVASLLQQRADQWRAVAGKTNEFRILPDTQWQDRVYPRLRLLGPALAVLNLDALMVTDDARLSVRLSNVYDNDRGRCVRRLTIPIDGARDAQHARFVALAGSLARCRDAVRGHPGIIADADAVPADLVQYLHRSTSELVGAYRRLFQHRPKGPLLMVAQDATLDGRSYRGDVGWQSMIFLNLMGDWSGWALDQPLRERVDLLLDHETAHLWIGKGLRPPHSTITEGWAWLQEGAAHYAALITAHRQGQITTARLLELLGSAAENCAKGLGQQSLLTDARITGGQLVYDCGVMVQLFYDLAIRKESGGNRSVFDVWASQLDASPVIDVEKFLASSSQARTLLTAALDGPSLDVAAVTSGLLALGATVDTTPSAGAVLHAVLMPLIQADCANARGSRGYWSQSDALVIDAPPTGCKTLSPGYRLRSIGGVDAIREPAGLVDAAQAACAVADATITVDDDDPQSAPLRLACAGPIQRPLGISLRGLPFIATDAQTK
ncbi:MAG: hypothetical protein LBE59_10905 [Nevskiaceae bacterium]|jgi:hypothetical protein|nr:hypothetical protein [Nevskiaceae bacterium]